MTLKSVDTLLDLLHFADSHTAVIVPELSLHVTYDSLRRQVLEMANALASAGIRRDDAVAIALPNGLPAIVSFLAASIAGKAAPLNPAYPYEEFHFFLGDTNARVLLCPPVGAEFVRTAAADLKIPVFSVEMNERGNVHLTGAPTGVTATNPTGDDIALVLHTSGSTGKPKRVPVTAFQPGGVLGKHREHLRPFRGRRFALHHAAVPHSWADWFDHGDLAIRRRSCSSYQIQRALFLAYGAGASGHVVFGSAHDAPASDGPNPPQAH